MSDLLSLKEELDLYLPGLSQRAGLIVANKIDLDGASVGLELLEEQLRTYSAVHMKDPLFNAPLVSASALHSTNTQEVKTAIRSAVETYRNQRLDLRTGHVKETY